MIINICMHILVYMVCLFEAMLALASDFGLKTTERIPKIAASTQDAH